MNIHKLLLLALIPLIGLVLRADPPVVSAPGPDSLAEVLPILQAKYADFNALHYKQGDQLEDLIARSKGGIRLLGQETSTQSADIVTASLPDNIIYWRLASFTPKKDWADLGAELQGPLKHYPHGGAILDLRSNTDSSDMLGAAQVMNLFEPEDDSLSRFSAKLADGNRFCCSIPSDISFRGPLIVLTDHQTTGSAEVLAAFLKADGALVIGGNTSGQGAVFEEQKLSSGKVLQYVTAHVSLPDGTDIWSHPITPDLAVQVDDQAEKEALALIRDQHISDLIQENPQRHRMSEASLVQGDDPEWDAYLSTLEKKLNAHFLLSLPPIHDPVLVSGIDSLKAIHVSQSPPALPSKPDGSSSSPTSVQ
jgi:C-terminal processing protease CtpA/Prc